MLLEWDIVLMSFFEICRTLDASVKMGLLISPLFFLLAWVMLMPNCMHNRSQNFLLIMCFHSFEVRSDELCDEII